MISKHKKQVLILVVGVVSGIAINKYLNLSVNEAIASNSNAYSEKSPDHYNAKVISQEVQKLGNIISFEEHPENNFIAWLVEGKNGKKMTFYTIGNKIFLGTLWDLNTKENLNVIFESSKQQNLNSQNLNQSNTGSSLTDANGLISRDFKGPVPEAITAIDSLGGIKIGNAKPADTLYIIIDPRCSYCHQAYNSLKPYMDKGVTIKWIPTVALGRVEEGLPLANAILHASNRIELDRIMANPKMYKRDLSDSDQRVLKRNLEYLFQAFEQSGEQSAGVPVAFFIDKVSGRPRMMMGISEMAVIEAILGK